MLRAGQRERLSRFRCDAPLFGALGRLMHGVEGPLLDLSRVRSREASDAEHRRAEDGHDGALRLALCSGKALGAGEALLRLVKVRMPDGQAAQNDGDATTLIVD